MEYAAGWIAALHHDKYNIYSPFRQTFSDENAQYEHKKGGYSHIRPLSTITIISID